MVSEFDADREYRADSLVLGAVRWIAEYGNYSMKVLVDKELENGLYMVYYLRSLGTFDNALPAYPKTRVFWL